MAAIASYKNFVKFLTLIDVSGLCFSCSIFCTVYLISANELILNVYQLVARMFFNSPAVVPTVYSGRNNSDHLRYFLLDIVAGIETRFEHMGWSRGKFHSLLDSSSSSHSLLEFEGTSQRVNRVLEVIELGSKACTSSHHQ